MGIKQLNKTYGDVIWYGRKRILGMPVSFTLYILTGTKLCTRTGLINLKEERVDLYRIVDFSLKLPFGQRMFGCGSVKVFSKDKSLPEQELTFIKNPREVLRLLEENVEKERQKYRIQGRDMVGSASFGSSDLYNEDIDD